MTFILGNSKSFMQNFVNYENYSSDPPLPGVHFCTINTLLFSLRNLASISTE